MTLYQEPCTQMHRLEHVEKEVSSTRDIIKENQERIIPLLESIAAQRTELSHLKEGQDVLFARMRRQEDFVIPDLTKGLDALNQWTSRHDGAGTTWSTWLPVLFAGAAAVAAVVAVI